MGNGGGGYQWDSALVLLSRPAVTGGWMGSIAVEPRVDRRTVPIVDRASWHSFAAWLIR